jgi:hypothetical protein
VSIPDSPVPVEKKRRRLRHHLRRAARDSRTAVGRIRPTTRSPYDGERAPKRRANRKP